MTPIDSTELIFIPVERPVNVPTACAYLRGIIPQAKMSTSLRAYQE